MKKLLSILLLVGMVGCTTSQIQLARKTDVTVYSNVVALDDTEWALCNVDADKVCHSAVPRYTTALHKEVRVHLTRLLKAAYALNEGVATAPVAPAAKLNLLTVSTEITAIQDLLKPVLGADNAVFVWITRIDADVVKLLPLFLQ